MAITHERLQLRPIHQAIPLGHAAADIALQLFDGRIALALGQRTDLIHQRTDVASGRHRRIGDTVVPQRDTGVDRLRDDEKRGFERRGVEDRTRMQEVVELTVIKRQRETWSLRRGLQPTIVHRTERSANVGLAHLLEKPRQLIGRDDQLGDRVSVSQRRWKDSVECHDGQRRRVGSRQPHRGHQPAGEIDQGGSNAAEHPPYGRMLSSTEQHDRRAPSIAARAPSIAASRLGVATALAFGLNASDMRLALLAFAPATLAMAACTFNGCANTDKLPPESTAADTAAAPKIQIRKEKKFYGADGAPVTATVAAKPRKPVDIPSNNLFSALGTNLAEVNYSSRDWPFLDAFRMASPWISRTWDAWDDGRPLDLDESGWVQSLLEGQIAASLVPALGGGERVLLYDGVGEVHLDGVTETVSKEPGRITFTARENTQVIFNITKTSPVSPIRNVRVVPSRYAQDAATKLWHPLFLERLRPFGVVRFMDWAHTNGSKVKAWSERTPASAVFQSAATGVAYEHMIALANELDVDPWFCVPHLVDDAYVRSLADLIKANLEPERKVYIEFSNEVWNDAEPFTQSAWLRGKALEQKLHSDPYIARLKLQARRSAEVFKIFEKTFRGSDRLVRVIGARIGDAFGHEILLGEEELKGNVDALAISVYFGGQFGDPKHEGELVGHDHNWLLDRIEQESLPEMLGWVADSAKVAKKNRVRLIAYEGGQHLVADPSIHNNATLNARLDEANRDPRMADLYATMLDGWRKAGGGLFVHFTYASEPNKWGRWGALESQDEPIDKAHKYRALIDFIRANPRWW